MREVLWQSLNLLQEKLFIDNTNINIFNTFR